jgi:hypothetical protein
MDKQAVYTSNTFHLSMYLSLRANGSLTISFSLLPKLDVDGNAFSPAWFTVLQNGVLIQNHVEVKGTTFNTGAPYYQKHNDKEPLLLQDHHCLVSYRNIWIREL